MNWAYTVCVLWQTTKSVAFGSLKLNPDDEAAMYKEAPGTARTYIHRALMRYRST